MERIFKIRTKSDRNPRGQYPSERRYSASIVVGLSVVFLQLFLYSILMGTLIVHKMTVNQNANTTRDNDIGILNETEIQELERLEEKLERDLDHKVQVSINVPALVCSGCFIMATGYFLSFSTGLLAWKRWYVDHNITFFFLAATFSTLTSALSLLLSLLTCLNMDFDYDTYNYAPSEASPITFSLALNIIILSSVGVIWSFLSSKVGYKGMRTSYPDDMGVGKGGQQVEVSVERKGNGNAFPPDIISHFPVDDKLAKYLPRKENRDLPKAESTLEYQQRVDKFLSGDGDNGESK
nr:uncharacterized protein LOC111504484 [Leptinotarsa decemlineata]XP_023014815.1 uncharacterized protein LOC111504484 [Leptinotarsa decemlineata]XP_023014816.1 uncharacterized protein LOC111504484 [Leptinotarsa decemlineata]